MADLRDLPDGRGWFRTSDLSRVKAVGRIGGDWWFPGPSGARAGASKLGNPPHIALVSAEFGPETSGSGPLARRLERRQGSSMVVAGSARVLIAQARTPGGCSLSRRRRAAAHGAPVGPAAHGGGAGRCRAIPGLHVTYYSGGVHSTTGWGRRCSAAGSLRCASPVKRTHRRAAPRGHG